MKALALLSLLPFALFPAAAHADGPPVTSLGAGPEGVTEHGGGDRYVALAAASRTVLAQSRIRGGHVMRATVLGGRWGIPVVANDGTTAGLSADGATLVVLRLPRTYPRRQSTFAVVDTGSLSVVRRVTLRGDWGYDALSPDGRWLYLVQQLSARDRTRYAIRAYDLRHARLMPDPVVDPREPDEPMQGLPITRVTSQGGRWEYTLYGGGRGHPFIHALDTARRESICIDLPHRLARSRHLFDFELVLRGRHVRVVHGDEVVASAARRPVARAGAGGPPWAGVAVALGALLVAAGGLRGAVRRRQG